MKANQFGTASEQQLFHMGFKTASERPQCGNCNQGEVYFINPDSWAEKKKFRCKRANCAVSMSSVCNKWGAK